MRARASKAFTLVEILIVVIILGILAAIVIPQFTSASSEAQVGNVETQLQTIRQQVELFRVRNNGSYPVFPLADESGWGNDEWVTAADPSSIALADRGLVGESFLRDPPVNPRTGTSTIVEGVEPTAVAAQGDDGWIWDATERTLYCNGFNEDYRTDGTNDPWFEDAP